MTIERGLAIAGIVLNLAGFLILFRYGMPYRVETRGVTFRTISDVDHGAVQAERRYRLLGNVGLVLTLVGTLLQCLAVLLA